MGNENDNVKYKNIINKFIKCNKLISKNGEYFNKIQNNNNAENPICYLIHSNYFIF